MGFDVGGFCVADTREAASIKAITGLPGGVLPMGYSSGIVTPRGATAGSVDLKREELQRRQIDISLNFGFFSTHPGGSSPNKR
jgi:hypothetical protein